MAFFNTPPKRCRKVRIPMENSGKLFIVPSFWLYSKCDFNWCAMAMTFHQRICALRAHFFGWLATPYRRRRSRSIGPQRTRALPRPRRGGNPPIRVRSRWVWGPTGPSGPTEWHTTDIAMDQIKLFKFSGSNSNSCFGCTKHTIESGKPTVGSQGNTSLKLYIFWQGAAPSGTSSGTYFTQEPTISRAKFKKIKIRGNGWSVVPIPTKKMWCFGHNQPISHDPFLCSNNTKVC